MSKEGYSRRTFMRMIGAAAGTVLIPKNSEGKPAAPRTTERTKYTAEETRTLLKEKINELAAIDTNIPTEQIVTVLKQCSFLADQEIPITQIRQYMEDNYVKQDRFDSNVIINIATGEYVPTEKLNVIQLRNFDIGLIGIGAFYEPKYHAIVIEESAENNTKSGRKKTLELFVGRKYLDFKYQDVDNDTQKYRGEPDDDIVRYYNQLINAINNKVRMNIRSRTQTIFGLPHEAFHHFFVTMLGEEGYAGPSVSELLYTAIDQTMQRFQKNDYPNFASFIEAPHYGRGFASYLRRYGIDNQEKLQQFCNKLASATDLTTLWKLYGNEDEKGKDTLKMHNSFSLFLNEYLARIYNGALGNTETRYAFETKRALQSAGFQDTETTADEFVEITHTPTATELGLLKRMSWQSRSLV